MLHVMAAIAEHEAAMISQRTKVALAAAKARGTKLGGRRVSAERFAEISAQARQVASDRAAKSAAELLPSITNIQASGAKSLRQIAAALNLAGVPAPKGGEWSAIQVSRVLATPRSS
jgi:DNA invertase Pin-like site-specific DNA recombinase